MGIFQSKNTNNDIDWFHITAAAKCHVEGCKKLSDCMCFNSKCLHGICNDHACKSGVVYYCSECVGGVYEKLPWF
jgi:hypothetical protein